jgi:DNA-binding MarR family transcriptional regulator/N-acetylglutamate synthase-like GNAT family acetyltransferase
MSPSTIAAVREADADPVARVRAFNRFYTNLVGVLRNDFLQTPYSVTEGRVIFELAQRDASHLTDLRRELDVDAGYMSRILARLEADGLIERERSSVDARRLVIRLTARGRAVYRTLDQRSAKEIGKLLSALAHDEQHRLLAAMGTVQSLLSGAHPGEVRLRPLGPGDYGWVVERHGFLYAAEYGWDERFEALVARIVADYIEHRDPKLDSAWIAEVRGERAGCVFCANKGRGVAQLRLLLVEAWARRLGLGTRLVDECIRFARDAGYERIVLWTNDVLQEARRIYQRAGFTLVNEQRHHSFGADLVGQNWSMTL